MYKTLTILAIASFVIAACDNKAPDSTDTAKSMNEKFNETKFADDAAFAAKAAEGGMLEVQLGELAQTNAESDKIKELGSMMMNDHSAANEELKKIAFDKGIALPAKLGNEKMDKYNELNAKKGNAFDKAYADFMVKDHEKDIKLFKDEAENGKDPDLKNWAAEKVPTLEHHLQMAKEAQEWIKK